jgi:hypothetical protein
MATEYAIFYKENDLLEPVLNQPVAAVKVQNDVVTITANQRFINQWTPYFERSITWPTHLKEDRPLSSFGATMTFAPFKTHVGKDGVEIYSMTVLDLEDQQATTVEIRHDKVKS